MRPVDHRWRPGDIVGGNAALDLINTVSGWDHDPEDWVPAVSGFLGWARMSGLLDAREKNQADRQAAASTATAERILASMKVLRLTLRRLVGSLEQGDDPGSEDLSLINRWARRLALARHVRVGRDRIEFALKKDLPALLLPGLRVTAAALALLENPPAARIKTCRGRNCGWIFMDRSKNRSRRWCDMSVCGNLSKARRFRARYG
jgi:predicted RNA-binding Zn ribbon-like protein